MPRFTRTTTISILLAAAALGTAAILSPAAALPALAVVTVVAGANLASDRLASRLER